MTRYNLALLGHSQRYLPPALTFVLVMGIQYGDSSAPLLPEFSVSAGAVLVVSCWLTVALLDVEDPVQRLITLSHTRRLWPVLAGAVLTVFTCAVGLTVVSELFAVLVRQDGPARDLSLGALAHVACAFTGIAIGLPCSRLLIGRIGWTVLAALVTLVVVLLAPWLPLVHPMLVALASDEAGLGTVLVAVGTSAAALAVSATAVGTLVRRHS